MPVSRVIKQDTVPALELNGQPFILDCRFPVWAIVPDDRVGTYSVKQACNFEVLDNYIWGTGKTKFHVSMGKDCPEEDYTSVRIAPITQQTLKCSLALPWPAVLTAGKLGVHRYCMITGVPNRQYSGEAMRERPGARRC